MPRLKRNLFLVGGIFLALAIAAITFSTLYVYQNFIREQPPLLTAEDARQLESINGLRQAMEEMQSKMESRTQLSTDTPSEGYPLQLLGPLSTMAEQKPVEINNARITRNDRNDVTISFELQNRNPNETRVRGYIVVLAKTPHGIFVYPDGAFSRSENILLNFNKGETFGISRFRDAQATFSNIRAEEGAVAFQILIFSFQGKILNSLHVQEERG